MSINCILSQSVELEKSVFDFTVKDIYGEDFNFSSPVSYTHLTLPTSDLV